MQRKLIKDYGMNNIFSLVESTHEAIVDRWIYRVMTDQQGVFVKRVRNNDGKRRPYWTSPFVQVWNGTSFVSTLGGHAVNVETMENAFKICTETYIA